MLMENREMKLIMKFSAPMALFFFMVSALSAAGLNADGVMSGYEVTLTIQQGEALVSKPSVLIVTGRQAELTWSDGDNLLQDFRVLLLAQAVAKDEVKLIAQIFEHVEGQWVLKSEPQVTMAIDAKVTFRTQFQSYTVGELIVDFEVTRAEIKQDGNAYNCSNANRAGSVNSSTDSVGPQCGVASPASTGLFAQNFSTRRAEDCCSVGCGGSTLTCCGAARCCDGVCGACCSPP